MRAYENSITINLHCCAEGNWQQEHVNKEQFSEFCQVSRMAQLSKITYSYECGQACEYETVHDKKFLYFTGSNISALTTYHHIIYAYNISYDNKD